MYGVISFECRKKAFYPDRNLKISEITGNISLELDDWEFTVLIKKYTSYAGWWAEITFIYTVYCLEKKKLLKSGTFIRG